MCVKTSGYVFKRITQDYFLRHVRNYFVGPILEELHTCTGDDFYKEVNVVIKDLVYALFLSMGNTIFINLR